MSVVFAVYCAFALAMSVFYGVYAVTIWFRAPELKSGQPDGGRAQSWKLAWKDILRHPAFLHQFWFNFIGAFAGWAALTYAAWRLHAQPGTFGISEAGLLVAALIGMTGYMPNTLHRIAGGVESLGTAVKRIATGAGK